MLRQVRNHLLKAKVKKQKARNSLMHYEPAPEFTFIIQFYNKRQNINPILSSLKKFKNQELIVLDDGSIDGSYAEWPKHLTELNHFLLRTNDLYEIRTYDRAIRMAKGKYVCLLQDDDLLPEHTSWLEEAKAIFESYPKLLILSGKQGVNLTPNNPYLEANAPASPVLTPTLIDPKTHIPFMFTMTAYRAPLFIRTKELIEIGGLDLSYSPLMCDDAELSLRAWTNGFSVGFYQVDCKRDIGIGGTRLFNSDLVKAQDKKNQKKLYQTYGEDLKNGTIQSLVEAQNKLLLQGKTQ